MTFKYSVHYIVLSSPVRFHHLNVSVVPVKTACSADYRGKASVIPFPVMFRMQMSGVGYRAWIYCCLKTQRPLKQISQLGKI